MKKKEKTDKLGRTEVTCSACGKVFTVYGRWSIVRCKYCGSDCVVPEKQ